MTLPTLTPTLTIARKLACLTSLGLALLLTVVVAGQGFTGAISGEAAQLARMTEAIRSAALADMAHDSLHAGVRLALISTDADNLDAAETEIDDAGAALLRELHDARDQDVDPTVAAAVAAVEPEVEAYRDLGLAVVAAGRAGESQLPAAAALEEQFSRLEEQLPAVGDAIDDANAAAQRRFGDARSSSRSWAIVLCVASMVVLGGVSLVLARSIIRPIRRTSEVLEAVAAGDLTPRVELGSVETGAADGAAGDEVVQMAHSLNAALDSLSTTMSAIGQHSASLASASEELTAVSSHLATAAQETSAQAGLVSAAAGQVSDNLGVVSAGTGEMNQSIQEISHGAQDAVSVADHAARVAQTTNDTVAKLGVSSAEIGNVVKVITSIAEQTNLLALNATIEAARAGEAGKGFAVVAHEVKELASATATATADISGRIGAIQTDATDAVQAIGEITEIIGRVGETQSSIASAVEQQTATTNEIGRNVAQAADNSTEIARNISGVAQSAQDASDGATDTLGTAADLSRMAGELQALVAGFRC